MRGSNMEPNDMFFVFCFVRTNWFFFVFWLTYYTEKDAVLTRFEGLF